MTSFLFACQGLGSWWRGVYQHDDGHPLLGTRQLANPARAQRPGPARGPDLKCRGLASRELVAVGRSWPGRGRAIAEPDGHWPSLSCWRRWRSISAIPDPTRYVLRVIAGRRSRQPSRRLRRAARTHPVAENTASRNPPASQRKSGMVVSPASGTRSCSSAMDL